MGRSPLRRRPTPAIDWGPEMRRRSAAAVTAAILALVLAASPAAAENSHFISATGSISGGSLTVAFKVAGLGNNVTDTITLSGHVTATWYCTNRGGHEPPGLYQTDEEISVSGTFTSGRNGAIVASITAHPTPALCPNGMRSTTLVSASWSNASLDDDFGAGPYPVQ